MRFTFLLSGSLITSAYYEGTQGAWMNPFRGLIQHEGRLSTFDYKDDNCTSTLSTGDMDKGIFAITDPDCPTQDGCFETDINKYCRFCEWGHNEPALPNVFKKCKEIKLELERGRSCQEKISKGDQKVGIDAIEDEECANNGPDNRGCFGVCRLCKKFTSPLSEHLYDCKDAPHGKKNESSSSSSDDEEITSDDNEENDEEEVRSPHPVPGTLPSDVDCQMEVTAGDNEAGVSAYGDLSCIEGGLGCFPYGTAVGLCRFCKYTSTLKSNHLNPCPWTASSGTEQVEKYLNIVAEA